MRNDVSNSTLKYCTCEYDDGLIVEFVLHTMKF